MWKRTGLACLSVHRVWTLNGGEFAHHACIRLCFSVCMVACRGEHEWWGGEGEAVFHIASRAVHLDKSSSILER